LWTLGAAAFWLVPDQKIVRGKLLAVQAFVIVIGAVLAVRAAKPGAQSLRSPLDLPVAALAGAGLLFWALSPDLAVSSGEAARLFFCALAFWTASRALAAEPGPFLTAWGAGASAAALWALAQAAQGQARPFASFGNPIFLGTALASALPLALTRAYEGTGRTRGLWSAAAALQTAALLLTHSRAAAFGLLAGLALWALARLSGRRLAAALGAAAFVAAAAFWAFRGREWTHALIWRDALALWRAHPLRGCGLGRFHIEFPAFASEALKARWPEGRVIVNFAHNEYLQTLVETGPLGLAALAAVPAAAWLALRREGASLERGAAAAGAFALFAAAFVSPDLRFGASAFAAFTLLGAAASTAVRGPAWTPVLPATALAVFAGLALQPAIAVRRNAHEANFFVTDKAGLKGAESRALSAPGDADAAEELGFLRAKASDFDGARSAFRRAAELDPLRPGPLNNLGNLDYLARDYAGAIGWWEKSLAAAPEQIDARLNLAKLLCERGRLKECSAQLEEVLRREPSNAKARVLYKKMVE